MIRRKFIHNSPYTDTHTYAYSYSYYFRCYLSLTLSLCCCVDSGGLSRSISSAWMVSSSAKGSDGDSVSATSTLAAPGIYYRLRFLGFFLPLFFLVFFLFVHSSTFVCVQLLWQFIHQAAKRANKNNNNGSEAHTTREGDQLWRTAAAPALLLLLPLLLSTSLYWVSAYKRITCIAIAAASVVVECCTVTMQTFCHTHDKSLFFVPLSAHDSVHSSLSFALLCRIQQSTLFFSPCSSSRAFDTRLIVIKQTVKWQTGYKHDPRSCYVQSAQIPTQRVTYKTVWICIHDIVH